MATDNEIWSYSELQTPKTPQEFQETRKSFLEEMKNLVLSKDWKMESETDGTVMESHSNPGSNIHMTRCTRTFDDVSKFENFADQLFDSSLEKKQAIYEDMLENKELKHIDDKNHVVFSQFKAPFPTWKREFVMLKSREVEKDGSHLITSCSINYEDSPFSKGFVRGVAKTAMLVTPLKEENKIRVIKVDYVDPKGWIPIWLLNSLKGKSINNINKMQGYL